MLKDFIVLTRPYQYTKNLFIFLPLFFGLKINQFDLFLQTAVAFLVFCLASSSVYILNDFLDINEDRNHPQKKHRPLASGKIKIKPAMILMCFLLVTCLVISYYFTGFNVFILTVIYLILNLLYSLFLKHIVIIDIITIAIGFIIRIFVGSEATGVPLSMWITIMTFLLALFLALAKRRDDLNIIEVGGNNIRQVIDGYNKEFINISIVVMASVIIVCYIMYTVSPEVISKCRSDKVYLTVIWVIVGILRYMQLTFVQNISGSPAAILIKDRFIQMVIIGWLISFGLIIYL